MTSITDRNIVLGGKISIFFFCVQHTKTRRKNERRAPFLAILRVGWGGGLRMQFNGAYFRCVFSVHTKSAMFALKTAFLCQA